MIMTSPKTCYINGRSETAPQMLAVLLLQFLNDLCSPDLPPVFVCIGSDRVTGDSLGPLIGTSLSHTPAFPFPVYGTLHRPIHALNLESSIQAIKKRHPGSPLVAIDASLGTRRHQNYITISAGSLCPGAGVDKELMEVGDISITGIINLSGQYAQMSLQNTRLSTVMAMANCISRGILIACGGERI